MPRVNAAYARGSQTGPLKLVEIHREDIETLPDLMAMHARLEIPLHRVLRRPVVRQRRHQLQVAQGGAGRRHRGPAGQCDLLRHLEPPPSDVARHDRKRTFDRHQSRRSGRGESVAVRPFRAVARLPPLQPGRISGDGRLLRRRTTTSRSMPRLAARGARMGDHPRLAFGPRCLAVYSGTWPAGSAWR